MDKDENKNLQRVCPCSIGNVHSHCIDTWINASKTPHRCPSCKYPYKLYFPSLYYGCVEWASKSLFLLSHALGAALVATGAVLAFSLYAYATIHIGIQPDPNDILLSQNPIWLYPLVACCHIISLFSSMSCVPIILYNGLLLHFSPSRTVRYLLGYHVINHIISYQSVFSIARYRSEWRRYNPVHFMITLVFLRVPRRPVDIGSSDG